MTEPQSLVTRLRELADPNPFPVAIGPLLNEAADRIEELERGRDKFIEKTTVGGDWDPAQIILGRRRIAALEEALSEIADWWNVEPRNRTKDWGSVIERILSENTANTALVGQDVKEDATHG